MSNVIVMSRHTQPLVRVKLLLIPAFVFDYNGVIFPIVWILFFVDGMYTTSILAISMRVVHLSFAGFQETPS